jgi:aminomethyltransferase
MVPAAQAEALWNDLLAAGGAPCGLGARDTLRLEAGMNLYGQDMDESTTPFEAGLRWTVALAGTREFIGRSALAQRTPRWNLLGLVLRERGVLRSHQPLRGAHGPGVVTSGTFSPTLGRSIALARLPPAATPGEVVEARCGSMCRPGVNYPFVRRGKSYCRIDVLARVCS